MNLERKTDVIFLVVLIVIIIAVILSAPYFMASAKEKPPADQKVGNWRLEAVGTRSVILHAPNGRQIYCYEDTKGKIQVLSDTTTFNAEAP
jgi:hypothetical protein